MACLRGRFNPRNRDKYKGKLNNIEYRSSWEKQMMHWCDSNPHVLVWNSEEVVIPYYSKADGKQRRYFMDFYVKMDDHKEYIFEVKPEKETRPPEKPKRMTEKAKKRVMYEAYTFQVNQDKWTAALKYAKERNWGFKVLTEHGLKRLIGLKT